MLMVLLEILGIINFDDHEPDEQDDEPLYTVPDELPIYEERPRWVSRF